MKIDWNRLQFDLQYIVLNRFANNIPVWHLRKRIYLLFGKDLKKNARIGIGTVVVNPKGITIG